MRLVNVEFDNIKFFMEINNEDNFKVRVKLIIFLVYWC